MFKIKVIFVWYVSGKMVWIFRMYMYIFKKVLKSEENIFKCGDLGFEYL